MKESAPSSTPPEPAKPIQALVERTASTVRENPVQSVVWAFFVGLVLTIFPVGRIVGIFTGLALALLRPVLLVLGVVKLCEEVEERRK